MVTPIVSFRCPLDLQSVRGADPGGRVAGRRWVSAGQRRVHLTTTPDQVRPQVISSPGVERGVSTRPCLIPQVPLTRACS